MAVCLDLHVAGARRWLILYLTIFTKYNHFTSNGNDGGSVHGGGWGKPEFVSLRLRCIALY